MASTRTRAGRLHLLTVREVQAAGDGDHSDGGGLMLRVRASSASWVLRYTAPSGRRREMGLGPARRSNSATAGESLTTARRLAREARDQVQAGADPIEERGRRRTAASQADAAAKAEKKRRSLTLARAARDYHERVIEPRLSAKHAAQWLASLENHVPPEIWHKPVDKVEAPELLAALAAVKPHERARNVNGKTLPETLRRIRQRLDAVFEDAIFHSRCSTNPAAAIRRKMREVMPKNHAGEFAALPYRDAPAFMTKVRHAEGLAARALELVLLSVGRTSEILLAEKPEFDLDAALWIVPGEKMKAGEEHVVYLPTRAVQLVSEIMRMKLHPVWMFPSPIKPDQPLSNMAMLTLLDRLGMRDRTTVHGLRATFSTWANDTAAARPDVIEACLAHEEGNKVRAAYNRAQFAEERRQLLAAWAEYLTSTAQVIPLHRGGPMAGELAQKA